MECRFSRRNVELLYYLSFVWILFTSSSLTSTPLNFLEFFYTLSCDSIAFTTGFVFIFVRLGVLFSLLSRCSWTVTLTTLVFTFFENSYRLHSSSVNSRSNIFSSTILHKSFYSGGLLLSSPFRYPRTLLRVRYSIESSSRLPSQYLHHPSSPSLLPRQLLLTGHPFRSLFFALCSF